MRGDLKYISAEKHSQITKGHLKEGDILLVTRGMIGEIARVPNCFVNANINAQLVRINGNRILPSSYLFLMMNDEKTNRMIRSNTSGTALQQLPIGALKSIKIIVPNSLSLKEFDVKVIDIFKLVDFNNDNIETLTTLRNTLLPKLISGEVRIKEFAQT